MATIGDRSNAPGKPSTPLEWLRLWFLLRDPVGRREYALSGFGLMAFKYVLEFVVVGQLTGKLYTPLDFVNPMMSARENFAQGAPDWFGFVWVLWALPFLWIAVGMSVRRALDAGISPWHGLWVLVPFANLLAMLVLGLPADRPFKQPVSGGCRSHSCNHQIDRPMWRRWSKLPLAELGSVRCMPQCWPRFRCTCSMIMERRCFLARPLLRAWHPAICLTSVQADRIHLTIIVAMRGFLFGGVAILFFALEGAICIVMAAPIVLPLGIAGAPIGKLLADRRRRLRGGLMGALLVIPLCAAVESQLPGNREFVVSSTIEVAAPPETVWRNVIGFSKITERPEWFFRMGIACPSEARIMGQGVGAVRECIFTTGKFVEPITTWDAPRRLAFDVRDQPDPMIELTPYRHIHPPHLDLAFRSTRGEFELVELPNGGTRLTGRTWYALDMRPHAYWTIWTDWLVHRIHQRVLRHIQHVAEKGHSSA